MNRTARTAIRAAICLGVVSVFVVPRLVHPDHTEEWIKRGYWPSPQDYAAIPLPIAEPPAGAYLAGAAAARPDRDGYQLSFEYNGYTIDACTRDERTASSYACVPQSAEKPLRTVRNGPLTTTYRASTKFDDPIADPAHRRIVEFFRDAPLAPHPAWIHHYVERQIAKDFG